MKMNILTADNLDANEAVLRITGLLAGEGYQVTRSFDLQTARAELRAPEECSCPNHGSAACDCQYVVLLVNQPGEAPATLVIHGHDDRTLVFVERREDPSPPAAALEEIIRRLVSHLAAVPQSSRQPTNSSQAER